MTFSGGGLWYTKEYKKGAVLDHLHHDVTLVAGKWSSSVCMWCVCVCVCVCVWFPPSVFVLLQRLDHLPVSS